MTDRRLIEEAFPLKEVSEHSKHEKNVRHGHISTLHIWPARRPLAAARAAIIAALMPDPGDEESRHALSRQIASITKWKSENGPALDFFRQEIRKAYGGRAPRVLDMFAGGGAIPLEAMRLGCDVTAIDYNPVAWFILKCTLEFPQKMAGKTWPLPADADVRLNRESHEPGDDDDDGEDSARAEDASENPATDAATGQIPLFAPHADEQKEGNLADHVRYWGDWVLEQARRELEPYYPTVDGKPTVAYLWARTVPCSDAKCGCTVPLLKTLWLSKKPEKTLPNTPENRNREDFLRVKRSKHGSRVVVNGRKALRIVPPAIGGERVVAFEIWTPKADDRVPDGTMSGSSVRCPSCGISMTGDYIKRCGRQNKLGKQMTSVMVDNGFNKDYRPVADIDMDADTRATMDMPVVVESIPYGYPSEPLPESGSSGAGRAFTIPQYGFETWGDLYTSRQILALSVFVKSIRSARLLMNTLGYPEEWAEALQAYLAVGLDRLADRSSTLCMPDPTVAQSGVLHTFARFALPITWDFIEGVTIAEFSGGFTNSLEWVIRFVDSADNFIESEKPSIQCMDARSPISQTFDCIVTDPPYYDAIPYADISDFFYVWLRRIVGDNYPTVFSAPLTPKSGELVQYSDQGENSGRASRTDYEAGMTDAFRQAWRSLSEDGYLVIVFAHKEPSAWETLVGSMIRSGFTVVSSWPIDTEMTNRQRAMGAAALSSSIWLVCRKRQLDAGTGRYGTVRKAMETRITERLRYFWDIGLSGPDFVWAAIGPALESYSSYDEVRRMNGAPFTVSEFLKEVRRLVADFALGQILHGQSTEGLDEWTRYYLMHRSSFGLEDAPVGECILLSQGYGIDLNDLRSARGYIANAAGSNVRLLRWDERTRDDLGQPHPSGGLPLIDMLHFLMQSWNSSQLDAINRYVAEHGLRQHDLFWAVAQAVLEMAEPQAKERTLLEVLVAWGRGKPAANAFAQPGLLAEDEPTRKG